MPSFGSLTYTFSRREKALIVLFTMVLVGLLWYRFVYIATTDQLTELDGRIQTVQSSIELDNTRLAQKKRMERIIEERKAAGVQAKPIPNYDNLKPLLSELDGVMAKTDKYSLGFDELDKTSTSYVLRGINMGFQTKTYEEAKNIIIQIADGRYPCIITSFSTSEHISTSTRSSDVVTTTLHVVYFEKPTI